MYRFATNCSCVTPSIATAECRACQLAEEFRGERTVNEHGHGAVSISSSLNGGSGREGGREGRDPRRLRPRASRLARSLAPRTRHTRKVYLHKTRRESNINMDGDWSFCDGGVAISGFCRIEANHESLIFLHIFLLVRKPGRLMDHM